MVYIFRNCFRDKREKAQLTSFCYSDQNASIKKNHDFSWLSPQIIKIHDLFMTIQVSDSNSGLFKFIHDCGNPAVFATSQRKGMH